MSSNQLVHATSPYLLMHKDNPVDWRPWGKEAFEEAAASGKPVLLSIGYMACHWCHVMSKESYEDAETARLMNELFVNVKVDREERPDIDQLYQAAAKNMGANGGWPLHMVLTPDAKPFLVAGYLPPEPRQGMPPFQDFLREASKRFLEKNAEVVQNGDAITQQLENLFNRDMRGKPETISLDIAAVRVGQRFDMFFGGVTGEAKFPNTSQIEVLFRAYLRSGVAQFLQLVTVTVDNIANGGLYDHVGGGFARYTNDERWVVPHFEKMLYDNALLIDLMSSLYQFNPSEISKIRVADTIGWLMREMKIGKGFAASLDSNSEGEEGKFYLWSEAEIDAALAGTFSARFKAIYHVTHEGSFQGRNILHRLGTAQLTQTEADEALFAKQRALLLAARDKRTRPMRDDKVLADWNGLVIAALANAGAVFERAEWITSAIETFDFVASAMGEGDRLFHSWANGKRGTHGFADDYVFMSRAALQLWEITGDGRFLAAAQKWVRTLNTHFWNESTGGYFFTSDDADPLIVRVRMIHDMPTESGNGVMIMVLARLWLATGEADYAKRADALLRAFVDEAQRSVMFCCAYFNGYEYLANALEILVIGPRTHPKTHELARAVWGRALPNRLIRVIAPEDSLPAGHPAFGKTMQNGQPTAYICQRGQCSAPITNPVTLSQGLQLPPRPAAGTA